ncbi:MAG: ABC transporter ATP-binding protein [Phycisphaerae bacterium]|nr:ABC transporter ATP-binding protein [Phycisphaerae bacterium]
MPTTTTQPAVLARGLHKRFRHTVAIDRIDLDIPQGQVFGLVGPDGSGKSTVLKILSGLLLPDRGDCEIFGCDVIKNVESVRGLIGFVPQGLGLAVSDKLTVRQNIDFFADLYHLPKDLAAQRSQRLLEITNLHEFQSRLARNLSGGMQQKLSLCCMLLHHPKLLILDEPTTGVDPVSRRDLWVILNDLVDTENITVVIATSYLDEAERCHHVALVHAGKILLQGSPTELPAKHGAPSLADLFVAQLEPQAEHHFKPDSLHVVERINKDPLPPNKPAVEVTGLVKRFGHFTAVDHVNFEIPPGAMYGFLGPNGAGKTTAIKMLCGILQPSGGDAYIAGFHVWHQRRKLKNRIGYMSQKFSLYRDLKVIENLRLYRQIYGRQTHDVLEVDELLEIVGLVGYEHRLTNELPVGLKQRLGLACSMVHLPDVLFLDEPTSGVDPLARERFWEIVRFLSRKFGITLLLTTHYMDEAEYCDRLAMINFGKIVAVGTPDQLKEQTRREKGALLEIAAKDYQAAKRLVDEHIAQTVFFGRRLHVFSQTPQEHTTQILTLLHKNNLPDATVRTAPIRLEDVFIHFARRTNAAEATP